MRHGWAVKAAVAALLALHLAFSLWPALGSISSDFANYYVPARAWREARGVERAYERAWFRHAGETAGLTRPGFFVPHPPANALLLAPLAGLPPLAAKAIWTAALAAGMALAFLVLRRALPVSPWLLALAFLVPSAALSNALAYGQPYPLLLLCLCLAFAALERGAPFRAGLLLAPVLVLKLYGLGFLAGFLWGRRFRAAAGMFAGAAGLTLVSIAMLGAPLHLVYVREILQPSLAGRVLDPYSVFWGSATSLSLRLFQHEPMLNPMPVADWPGLAVFLGRAVPAGLLALSVLLAGRATSRRAFALLALGSLAASPLASTYHFTLLILPVALLLADVKSWGWLAALAFCGSSLGHHLAPVASGWGNLLAYPRLACLIAMLLVAAQPWRRPRLLAAAAVIAMAAGTTARAPAESPGWVAVNEARGLILAEPLWCGGSAAWLSPDAEAWRLWTPTGVARPAAFARCGDGRVETDAVVLAQDMAPARAAVPEDVDARPTLFVYVDAAGSELRERIAGVERVLARGRLRHPRLSPDGAWVVYQQWSRGSWNIAAVERRSGRSVAVTDDPANELEPSWTPEGDVLFASDRRRGLDGTALYRVRFVP